MIKCSLSAFAGVAVVASLCFADPVRIEYGVYENQEGVDTTGFHIYLDVTDNGDNTALVEFVNASASDPWAQYVMTGIAFEASAWETANILSVVIASQDTDVDFASGSIPTGGSPAEWGGDAYSFKANPPPTSNGVEGGEWINFTVSLQAGTTFGDLIYNLKNPGFRTRVHVQNSGDGGEDSFWLVTVPLPTTAALAGVGLLGLGTRRSRGMA